MAPDTALSNTTANGTSGYTTLQSNAGITRWIYTWDTQVAVDSKHVVHVALTDGLNVNYPACILESIFKVVNKKNY